MKTGPERSGVCSRLSTFTVEMSPEKYDPQKVGTVS
jgi:hypothetical protein